MLTFPRFDGVGEPSSVSYGGETNGGNNNPS